MSVAVALVSCGWSLKGFGMRNWERSVSAKWPPSMCSWRERVVIIDVMAGSCDRGGEERRDSMYFVSEGGMMGMVVYVEIRFR